MFRPVVAVCALLGAAFGTVEARAHPSPHSSIELEVRETVVRAVVKIPLAQLELAFKVPLSARPSASLARYRAQLQAYLPGHVSVRTPDGRPWTVAIEGELALTEKEDPVDLVADLRLTPPAGASNRAFTLESDLVQHEVMNHKIFVTLKGSGAPRLIAELRYLNTAVKVDLDERAGAKVLVATFRAGARHIAEGTDHLLFLLMLLLPAPLAAAGGRWGGAVGLRASLVRLVRIVTAFTAGHSLTLVLGAVGGWRPANGPVEALVAASVLVSAVHAFRPIFPGREAWIAGGFGLVHGLAFSSAVAELGVTGAPLALSVLGFNLGIEAMQLALVAGLAPGLIRVARTSVYPGLRRGGAGAGGLAAAYWLVERLFF